MTYLRGVLGGLAALIVTVVGYEFWWLSKVPAKATGVAALVGIAAEALFSPWCWLIAGLMFVLFFAAARLSSKPLRALLFWTPVTGILILGFGFFGLVAYFWVRVRQG